jgi:tagatose 1,6-diphosphate aldolase GatY/KbaY
MSIVPSSEILTVATEEGYGVGAFNIFNVVQLMGVVEAHVEKHAPLILQTSVGTARLFGPDVLVSIFRTLAEDVSIPIALHLDHCNDVQFCRQCADAGYTSIMIDLSRESFQENMRRTSEVVDFCHGKGRISVEGELGNVPGREDAIVMASDQSLLCDPDLVNEFVETTGVDLLAPAIGTVHGPYSSKRPHIDFARLERISVLLRQRPVLVPLVVHGVTGLPREYVRRLIRLGASKFNIATDIKFAVSESVSRFIAEHPDDHDLTMMDFVVKDAVRDRVTRWIEILGGSGKV